MNIGERLKSIRQELKFSQKEFGKILDVQQTAISNYEKNRFEISNTIIDKLVNEFDINANWLITGKGEMFGESGNNLSDTLQTLVSAAKTNPAIKTLLLNALNADDESERKSYIEALNMLLKNA